MKAGKTNLDVGTKIKTTKKWDDVIITGTITHPFGCFGGYDKGAIAGIYIDTEFQKTFGKTGNLFEGDFKTMVSDWPWIECPNKCIGQRGDPELLKKATPICPECNSEMIVKEETE